MNLEDAKSYAARLTLAGGRWRLPTLSELETLYKATRSSRDIAAYPGMDKGIYLSTSPCEDDPTDVRGVVFALGGGGEARRIGGSLIGSVRCVKP